MKIRKGFVSNSSSSSFIIKKYYLSEYQINMIRDYEYFVKSPEFRKLEEGHYSDNDEFDRWDDFNWIIEEDDEYILGHTYMDNFYIEEYFDICGIENAHDIFIRKV